MVSLLNSAYGLLSLWWLICIWFFILKWWWAGHQLGSCLVVWCLEVMTSTWLTVQSVCLFLTRQALPGSPCSWIQPLGTWSHYAADGESNQYECLFWHLVKSLGEWTFLSSYNSVLNHPSLPGHCHMFSSVSWTYTHSSIDCLSLSRLLLFLLSLLLSCVTPGGC